MLSYSQFIQEDFKSPADLQSALDWYKPMMKLCYQYGDTEIVWRGVHNKSGIILATNDRQGYMGAILPHVKNHINNLKELEKKNKFLRD